MYIYIYPGSSSRPNGLPPGRESSNAGLGIFLILIIIGHRPAPIEIAAILSGMRLQGLGIIVICPDSFQHVRIFTPQHDKLLANLDIYF